MLYAGIKNQPAVFLFSDTQIVFEAMLEDVNNVLNTGDVPNLYAPEDDETITTACKQDCLRAAAADEIEYFRLLFGARHGELALDIMFLAVGRPSEIGCACSRRSSTARTIDWFAEWPREALHSVAHRAGCSRRRIWSSVTKIVTWSRGLEITHLEARPVLLLSIARS